MHRCSIFNYLHLFLCIVVVGFESCVSPQKAIYFNDLQPSFDSVNYALLKQSQRIQPGDRIMISVVTREPEGNALFNAAQGSGVGMNQQTGGGFGILVKTDGTILLPLVGEITAAGFNPEELQEAIRSRISRYYKDPVVTCNVAGRVLFLGGAGVTGIVPITNHRLTIIEAFALAGTPAPTSKRDRVWVIRETDGVREYNRVNLNTKDIFHSKFYYLRNNDLIYVEPGTAETFIGVNAPVRNLVAIGTGSLGLIISLIALFK